MPAIRKAQIFLVTLSCALCVQSTQAAPLSTLNASIIPVAAYAARGDTGALSAALVDALSSGTTVNELKEVLVHLYAYAGFPRSLTALGVFIELLKERKARGIVDETGRENTPLAVGTDIRALGTKVQTELIGKLAAGPVYDFAPAIDTYLKEHLFGDIFSGDVIDRKTREIATVSILSALPAPVQLKSHFNACLNVGLTPEELVDFVFVFKTKVGGAEYALAHKTLKEFFAERNISVSMKSE